jgi:alginate O-acetyltransferase complex protein AlgI
MVFSSPIFLFAFLPIVLVLHFLAGQKFRNVLLLGASLVFYAWGEKEYALVMLVSILLNYLFALFIGRTQSKPIFVLALGVNLSILIFFKYANFLVDNLNVVFRVYSWKIIYLSPVHLPLGISFFTFHALSYLIDIYRKKVVAQKDPVLTGLYISFFPQLIAGPIVRYAFISAQLSERKITLEKYAGGLRRFVIGLGKKVLIANTLGLTAAKIFAIKIGYFPSAVAWLGIVCYTLQIYFDFSGYSDMAIGLARLFGFEFPENFNYPYISESITEFWRRWHISLSSWFRDYLYIPLGGNRCRPRRVYFNLLVVFFLCGLWHGARWNFVIWGLFHGMFLVIERLGFGEFLKKLWRPLRHLYALTVVMIAWVFFRSESVPYALEFLKTMFGCYGKGCNILEPHLFFRLFNAKVVLALGAGIIVSTPGTTFHLLEEYKNRLGKTMRQLPDFFAFAGLSLAEIVFLFLVFLYSTASIAADTFNPFIYFRF